MANISSASGTMYLSRKFYDKNKELIDNWVKYYQTPQNYEYYGFAYMKIEEVTEDEVWLKFDGEGRWSWGDTLENIFSSDKFRSQINPYRDDLINRLYEDKEEIEMEYKDYEPGCEILVEREVILIVKKYDNKGKYYTEVIVDTDIDITYNDYNRIKTGVEDGYLLDENKEELLEVLRDFYYKNKDMVSENDYRVFKKDVLTFIKDDSELKGGICSFRLKDCPEFFLDDLENSLKKTRECKLNWEESLK